MSIHDQESERLRQEAVALMWRGCLDEALAAYDVALATAESEDQRELVTIGKAEALIAADRDGAEVRELAAIVMRRRSPGHVYRAAYALMYRYSDTDCKRAMFYGEIASKAAAELDEIVPRAKVLNGLGVIQMIDARFGDAADSFARAIAFIEPLEGDDEAAKLMPSCVANLGGAKIHSGDFEEGLALINSVLPLVDDPSSRADFALDLCYAYLQLDRFDEAHAAGEEGLALATEQRLVRNAHYLLGEIAVRTDHFDEAEQHFEALESFYPDFPNLRNLLLAVDLCPILNLKSS